MMGLLITFHLEAIALILILLNVWNFGEFFLELNSKEPYLSSENEKKLVVLSLCPP